MSGAKFNLRGKMTLTVHSARGLSNKELVGKMDPFTVITVSGSKDEKFKTKIAKDQHQTPVWEQSYIFNLEGKEELLHCNVWNEATLGDDHIGRLDLTLDALDMSGKPRWYQIKDKQNFTKQTGEVSMSIVFDGSGLPAGSLADTTHKARVSPAAVPSAAVTPASPPPIVQAAPIASPAPPAATVAPPVVQQQSQPNYQQAPPQQQPMYGSQQQQQYHSQPQQPQYAPAPVYSQQPAAPVYQQPPAPVYSQPPMQPIVYQQQAPAPVQYQQMPVAQPVYQQAQPVYQQPQPVYQQAPTITYQPAPQTVFVQQPAPAVVYQQVGGYPGAAPRGQLIGYYPNGQPRYA